VHKALVLQAGAGTGKTHALVELCVELLAGGLPPSRLCALTFTEKAAAELKGRLYKRVGAVGEAQVGTIHSLCAQILRRHAVAAGIDPQFVVLDELEGRRVLREACEQAALHALEAGDAGARRLCAEMGLRAQGKFGAGLADELGRLLGALAESGVEPRLLDAAAAL